QMLADQQQSDYSTAVATGLVVYDPAAARRCLSDMTATPCEKLFKNSNPKFSVPSCLHVTRGTVKNGYGCSGVSAVCESGNCLGRVCGPVPGCPAPCGAGQYCDPASNACAAKKPAGAACATHDECRAPSVCLGSVCAAPLADGSSCIYDDDCMSGV